MVGGQVREVFVYLNSFISDGSLPPIASNPILTTPRTSHIDFLLKVHKANNPGRPIVSACSCPILSSSPAVVRFRYATYSTNSSYYIKDTTHALRIFNDFRFQSETKFLFTMDAKSLYTVIPNDEGLRTLKHFLIAVRFQYTYHCILLRLY